MAEKLSRLDCRLGLGFGSCSSQKCWLIARIDNMKSFDVLTVHASGHAFVVRVLEVNESAFVKFQFRTAHKFFWQQQFFQRTVMVASVPFQDGLAKLSTSWSSHRSLFRWQSRMDFSCEHTHSHIYNSRRSFVIPKSKAVAEERSSVKIHPIQCIWQNVGLLVP